MAVQRMDHVGIVVDDLDAAKDFFVQIGLEAGGVGSVKGAWVDRIIGLEGAHSDIVMMRTPDGRDRVELVKFHAPPYEGDHAPAPSNKPGIRHLTFAVDDLDAVVDRLGARGAELVGEIENYEDVYRLCYVRGPAAIIVELAERIG